MSGRHLTVAPPVSMMNDDVICFTANDDVIVSVLVNCWIAITKRGVRTFCTDFCVPQPRMPFCFEFNEFYINMLVNSVQLS